MAATRRVDSAGSWISEQPSPTPQAPAVTAVAQKALTPKTNLPRNIDDIRSRVKQAHSLFNTTKYSEAAEAYQEVISLLNDTTDVQGLLSRSSSRNCLALCLYFINESIDGGLIQLALADLDQALLKLESSSDDVEKVTYYQKIREHYIIFKTWYNTRLAFFEEKIKECENKVDEIKMRTHLAIVAAAPSEHKVVLPLPALQDEKEFTTLFGRVRFLTDHYHYAEAGVHVLKFRERLKDPLDPQKLIWRAHCNIQLSEGAFMGRFNLHSTVASNNRHLMMCLAADAFEDLKKAQQSLASRDIVSSDTLRRDLYQRLHRAYQDLSRLEYWQTGAKINELSQECLEKAQAAPSPPIELPKQEPQATPTPPQKESTQQYSKIKIIFVIAMGFLGAILAVSLYRRLIVKKYI